MSESNNRSRSNDRNKSASHKEGKNRPNNNNYTTFTHGKPSFDNRNRYKYNRNDRRPKDDKNHPKNEIHSNFHEDFTEGAKDSAKFIQHRFTHKYSQIDNGNRYKSKSVSQYNSPNHHNTSKPYAEKSQRKGPSRWDNPQSEKYEKRPSSCLPNFPKSDANPFSNESSVQKSTENKNADSSRCKTPADGNALNQTDSNRPNYRRPNNTKFGSTAKHKYNSRHKTKNHFTKKKFYGQKHNPEAEAPKSDAPELIQKEDANKSEKNSSGSQNETRKPIGNPDVKAIQKNLQLSKDLRSLQIPNFKSYKQIRPKLIARRKETVCIQSNPNFKKLPPSTVVSNPSTTSDLNSDGGHALPDESQSISIVSAVSTDTDLIEDKAPKISLVPLNNLLKENILSETNANDLLPDNILDNIEEDLTEKLVNKVAKMDKFGIMNVINNPTTKFDDALKQKARQHLRDEIRKQLRNIHYEHQTNDGRYPFDSSLESNFFYNHEEISQAVLEQIRRTFGFDFLSETMTSIIAPSIAENHSENVDIQADSTSGLHSTNDTDFQLIDSLDNTTSYNAMKSPQSTKSSFDKKIVLTCPKTPEKPLTLIRNSPLSEPTPKKTNNCEAKDALKLKVQNQLLLLAEMHSPSTYSAKSAKKVKKRKKTKAKKKKDEKTGFVENEILTIDSSSSSSSSNSSSSDSSSDSDSNSSSSSSSDDGESRNPKTMCRSPKRNAALEAEVISKFRRLILPNLSKYLQKKFEEKYSKTTNNSLSFIFDVCLSKIFKNSSISQNARKDLKAKLKHLKTDKILKFLISYMKDLFFISNTAHERRLEDAQHSPSAAIVSTENSVRWLTKSIRSSEKTTPEISAKTADSTEADDAGKSNSELSDKKDSSKQKILFEASTLNVIANEFKKFAQQKSLFTKQRTISETSERGATRQPANTNTKKKVRDAESSSPSDEAVLDSEASIANLEGSTSNTITSATTALDHNPVSDCATTSKTDSGLGKTSPKQKILFKQSTLNVIANEFKKFAQQKSMIARQRTISHTSENDAVAATNSNQSDQHDLNTNAAQMSALEDTQPANADLTDGNTSNACPSIDAVQSNTIGHQTAVADDQSLAEKALAVKCKIEITSPAKQSCDTSPNKNRLAEGESDFDADFVSSKANEVTQCLSITQQNEELNNDVDNTETPTFTTNEDDNSEISRIKQNSEENDISEDLLNTEHQEAVANPLIVQSPKSSASPSSGAKTFESAYESADCDNGTNNDEGSEDETTNEQHIFSDNNANQSPTSSRSWKSPGEKKYITTATHLSRDCFDYISTVADTKHESATAQSVLGTHPSSGINYESIHLTALLQQNKLEETVLNNLKEIDLKLLEMHKRKMFVEEMILKLQRDKMEIDFASMQLQNEKFLIINAAISKNSMSNLQCQKLPPSSATSFQSYLNSTTNLLNEPLSASDYISNMFATNQSAVLTPTASTSGKRKRPNSQSSSSQPATPIKQNLRPRRNKLIIDEVCPSDKTDSCSKDDAKSSTSKDVTNKKQNKTSTKTSPSKKMKTNSARRNCHSSSDDSDDDFAERETPKLTKELENELKNAENGSFNATKLTMTHIKICGKFVIASAQNGYIYKYCWKTKKMLAKFSKHTESVTQIHIDGNNFIYSVSMDGFLKKTSLEEFGLEMQSVNLEEPLQSIEVAWDTCFVGSKWGNVFRYNISDNKVADSFKFSANSSIVALKATHIHKSKTTRCLVVASKNDSIRIINATSGHSIRTIKISQDANVSAILITQRSLFIGSNKNEILAFDIETEDKTTTTIPCEEKVLFLKLLQRVFLLVGYANGSIDIFNVKNKKKVSQFKIGEENLTVTTLDILSRKIVFACKNNDMKMQSIPSHVLSILSNKK